MHVFAAPTFEFVKNINHDFLIFDNESQSLLPITNGRKGTNTIFFKIFASEINNQSLFIKSSIPFFLYIDDKLIAAFPAKDTVIGLEKFSSQYLNGDHMFFSINGQNVSKNVTVDLYKNVIIEKSTIAKSDNVELKEDFSENKQKKNKYIIGLILSLLTFVLIKVLIPNIYSRVFKFQMDVSSLMERSSSKLSYFQNESIFIFVFVSILSGIYAYVFFENITIMNYFFASPKAKGSSIFIFSVLATFLLFVVKFGIYKIVSFVFGLTNFHKLLTNEFSKTIFQTLILVYPIYFIFQSPFFSHDLSYSFKLIYPLILVLLIFILKELYYFFGLVSFNKLYIIAYICICDLFPTCIFIKILTQSEFI